MKLELVFVVVNPTTTERTATNVLKDSLTIQSVKIVPVQHLVPRQMSVMQEVGVVHVSPILLVTSVTSVLMVITATPIAGPVNVIKWEAEITTAMPGLASVNVWFHSVDRGATGVWQDFMGSPDVSSVIVIQQEQNLDLVVVLEIVAPITTVNASAKRTCKASNATNANQDTTTCKNPTLKVAPDATATVQEHTMVS